MPTGDAARVRRRLGMLAFVFAIGFTALSARTIQLAQPLTPAVPEIAAAEPASTPAPGQQRVWRKRNVITDRRGDLLAVDLPTRALMVHRRRVKDLELLGRQLADALGESDATAIIERLGAASSSIFIRRRLTFAQVSALYESR